ncbi:right-handed parallel beta-helix repeat-containing protein [Brevundimonas terrae]|uniref:Right-handed parallel beta-helix repeat-containing protein n=1 Tax=Brevundimonas terrae TaxID=363631 RepID=A0ABN0Y546_9CAUL|nr:parallel beta-helix repeat protein [Brevundimonas terrae]
MITALILAASLSGAVSAAPSCSPEQVAALTALSDTPYRLTCSARLAPDQPIRRHLVLEGPQSSNVTLDCNGGSIGRPDTTVSASAPTVMIRSEKSAGGQWLPTSGITVRNCHVFGAVRVWGMGADGSYDDLRLSSRQAGHTEHLQAVAPRHIRLEQVRITARGTIPLYVGPGVTRLTLEDATLDGTTTATAVYLDAESADNTLRNNRILTRTGREMIAIDGSARNTISGNRFDLHGQPGIYLYRNCGERGVIRHQTPSDNIIENNSFTGTAWLRPRLVVENARNGRRSYCGADSGYPFGSSIDDRDNATGNTVRNNRRP